MQQKNDVKAVNVTIMGNEFSIKVDPEEAKGLQECADYLNEKIQMLREKMSHFSYERLMTLTALNITSELLQERKRNQSGESSERMKAQRLLNKIKDLLQTEVE